MWSNKTYDNTSYFLPKRIGLLTGVICKFYWKKESFVKKVTRFECCMFENSKNCYDRREEKCIHIRFIENHFF